MGTKYTSKKGKHITIRKAERKDAKELVDFANLVFDTSDTTLTSSGEFQFTEEKEAEFIENMNVTSDNSIMLVAVHNESIVGMLGFHGSRFRKNKHTGVFGISVHPSMRNEGIGRILITVLLNWAKKHPIIERVELSAFSHNENGLHLYLSLGFEEEGRKKKGARLDDGTYVDMILMYQFV